MGEHHGDPRPATLDVRVRDVSLDDIYTMSGDNRQLGAELEALEVEWDQLNALATRAADPQTAAEIRRDGHCHEAVMWYTHHLNERVKRALAASGLGIEIPLLSEVHHADRDDLGVDQDVHLAAVLGVYEEQV